MLRYHAKALQLVGAIPSMAPETAQAMAAVENRIGRSLPASLREWYLLDGACDLLMRYSNADPPVAITDLGQDAAIARDLLVFRHENQGVCSWAVWLNGNDDPPVVVDYETAFKKHRPCARTFSEYVYASIWDWGQALREPLIQAQNQPLSLKAIEFLQKNFSPEVETRGWPGDRQYRFFSADQRILIWAADGQADWWLTGDSEDALLRLVRMLRDVDDLGRSLWSNDSIGESLIQRAAGG